MKSPVCKRLTEAIEARKRWSRHTTKAELRRLVREHCCPECPGSTWHPAPNLPRDPNQETR